jgi:formate hydrogenlyase subunit 4
MEYINYFILSIYFILFPLFLGGIIRKVRARAQGRKGPSVQQNLYDFLRLWGKSPIDGPNSALFAESGPVTIFLSSVIVWSIVTFEWTSILMIPFFLALQRMCILGFAMETGTSFGGLGSSRELLLAICSEPILIMSLLVAQSKLQVGFNWMGILMGLLFLGAFMVAILAELAKPPFDDPRTHLELTMVHEAMLLEASGRTLAYFEGAAQIKIASFLVLLMRVGIEHTNFNFRVLAGGIFENLAVFLGAIFLAIFLGYWEARSVRRKWIWVPEIMGMTFLFLLVLGTLIKI